MSSQYSDKINSTSSKSNFNNKNNKSYQTILATDIPLTYSESDLYSIFSRYGSVNKIQKLSNLSCCLIEFSDRITAANLIQTTKSKPFLIGGHKIKLELTSQSISISDQKLTDNSTHILSLTISNVKYPITVDIIKQICQKFGKLLRIFIGKKSPENLIECLVEFEKVSDSKTAKDALHGEDIYSGCCSLDVKYSRIPAVPVPKNDHESWDFTKQSPSKPGILKSPPERSELIPSPFEIQNRLYRPPVYPMYPYPPPMFPPGFKSCRQMPPSVLPPMSAPLGYGYFPSTYNSNTPLKHVFLSEPGTVFMIQNLAPNVCADHLFNIFCIYGNVKRIRFGTKQSLPLQSQPLSLPMTTSITAPAPLVGAAAAGGIESVPIGTAVVQMGSRAAAEACVLHFHGQALFGGAEMHLVHCPTRSEVEAPRTSFTGQGVAVAPGCELLPAMPNGTAAFRDFSRDPNNRFPIPGDTASASPGATIAGPNRTLHFFNAPPSFRDADLTAMLIQSGVARPVQVVVFASRVSSQSGTSLTGNGGHRPRLKSGAGLIEFSRLEDALVALCVLNHKMIVLPETSQVFHIKFNFSARGEPRTASLGSSATVTTVTAAAAAPIITATESEASSPKRCKSDDSGLTRTDSSVDWSIDQFEKIDDSNLANVDNFPKINNHNSQVDNIDYDNSNRRPVDNINGDDGSKADGIDISSRRVVIKSEKVDKISPIDYQSKLSGNDLSGSDIISQVDQREIISNKNRLDYSDVLKINNHSIINIESQTSFVNSDNLSNSNSECVSQIADR